MSLFYEENDSLKMLNDNSYISFNIVDFGWEVTRLVRVIIEAIFSEHIKVGKSYI